MYLGVIDVRPLPNYELEVKFENNHIKVFDVKPYLEIGIFKELKDKSMFKSVHISFDTVEWTNGADLDPEVIYQDAK